MTDTLTPSVESVAKRPFYKRRGFVIGAMVLAIPAIALAWWLGSPLFLDTVVDEEFPTVTAAAAPTAIEEGTSEGTAEPAAGTADAAAEASEPASPTSEADTAQAITNEAAVDQDSTGGEATGPVAVLTGDFAGADDFHQGSGTATIYELEDGSHVLRFEDFEVTNGPDLHVLISETDTITSSEDLNAAGYVDLGKLKGNVGNQNYELPAGFAVDGPVTITIYCDPFHVVFATATLSPAT